MLDQVESSRFRFSKVNFGIGEDSLQFGVSLKMQARIEALVIHCKPETADLLRIRFEKSGANQCHLAYHSDIEERVCVIAAIVRQLVPDVLHQLEDCVSSGGITRIEFGNWETDAPTIEIVRTLAQELSSARDVEF